MHARLEVFAEQRIPADYLEIIKGEQKMTNNSDCVLKRLEIPVASWGDQSPAQQQEYFEVLDKEVYGTGIVSIASALTAEQCDEFTAIIRDEIEHASRIERTLFDREGASKGYKVRAFHCRHEAAMNLIAHPFTTAFFRRYLGEDMVLHSSEGVLVPPGTSDGGLHYDGYDRIENYFLSMNSIYYLCDTTPANGATRYIPGTHKEFLDRDEVRDRPHHYASVQKGDLVLFNPYLWHGSSANSSGGDRPVIINYYQRSYIRQEFDYYRLFNARQKMRLTANQRAILGLTHPVPQDLDEIYMIGAAKNSLRDFDPLAF
jgi:ectoine hydroxylase-related dioxygenase (phytanoyl-CoA dioxygenase family)